VNEFNDQEISSLLKQSRDIDILLKDLHYNNKEISKNSQTMDELELVY